MSVPHRFRKDRMGDESKSYAILGTATDRARKIAENLLRAPIMDAAEVAKGSVPRQRGIYLWRSKGDGKPVYIGVGLGRKGLQQRIVCQHLCHSYIKSVFRTAIERQKGIGGGRESVQFIREQFTLAVVECHEESPDIVKAAEALLIAALSPQYNKTHGERTTTPSR